MSADQQPPGDDATGDTEWDAYSQYADISRDVASSVQRAIEAHARLESRYHEDVTINLDLAVETRARILAAARRLLTELRVHEDEKEVYSDILDDWVSDDEEEAHGYIDRLQELHLGEEYDPFVEDFVDQIHRAAWHLGYLKAGQHEETEPENETEAEARAMLEDIIEAK